MPVNASKAYEIDVEGEGQACMTRNASSPAAVQAIAKIIAFVHDKAR